jgi:hypothetical protein
MRCGLYAFGIRKAPAKSTLADANESRDFRIFQDVALSLIRSVRKELPRDEELDKLGVHAAFALDSTTIDLCLSLFPWAHFRKRKGGVKAHVLLDLHFDIPVFMRVTHAKTVDVCALDFIDFLPGAYYVMDKGYVDFKRFWTIDQAKAYFVTRAKRNMDYRIVQRRPVAPGGPVTHDQHVRLCGPKSRHLFPGLLRRVRYICPKTGRRFVFLTNHLTLDAATVAMLYRRRWDIEQFFRWIKQHLHIKGFFGTTPNAVQTQLWIAVIVLVMIHRLKHRLGLPQTPYEIAQILRMTATQKTPIIQPFSDNSGDIVEDQDHNQLKLFEL